MDSGGPIRHLLDAAILAPPQADAGRVVPLVVGVGGDGEESAASMYREYAQDAKAHGRAVHVEHVEEEGTTVDEVGAVGGDVETTYRHTVAGKDCIIMPIKNVTHIAL